MKKLVAVLGILVSLFGFWSAVLLSIEGTVTYGASIVFSIVCGIILFFSLKVFIPKNNRSRRNRGPRNYYLLVLIISIGWLSSCSSPTAERIKEQKIIDKARVVDYTLANLETGAVTIEHGVLNWWKEQDTIWIIKKYDPYTGDIIGTEFCLWQPATDSLGNMDVEISSHIVLERKR